MARPPAPSRRPLAPRGAAGASASRARARWSPGALDARAGDTSRLVGLLVHADPPGVSDRPGRGAARSRAPRRAAPSGRWLAAVHLGVAATVGLSYLVMDKLPGPLTWAARGDDSASTGSSSVSSCSPALAVLPATVLMGGVFPLTVRIAAARPDSVGRDVGIAYAINTVGRDRRLVRRPASSCCRSSGCSAGICVAVAAGWRWRRCCSGCASVAPPAPGAARGRRRRWRCSAWWCRAGASVRFSAGLFRVSIAARRSSKSTSKLGAAGARVFYHDGIATTVSRRALGQDRRAQEQRQGRRLERRRHGHADHGRPDAVPLPSDRARNAAEGRGGRLRLGRDGRRGHPVPHRARGHRRARAAVVERATRFFGNDNHTR